MSIRDDRKALGLTQRQLGTLLRYEGDPGRNIRRYETGERQVSGQVALVMDLLRGHVTPEEVIEAAKSTNLR